MVEGNSNCLRCNECCRVKEVEDASFVDTEWSTNTCQHEAIVSWVPQVEVRSRDHVGMAEGKVQYPCKMMDVRVW